MVSLVHELQAQALDPNVLVTDLLRKVKVVASKLELGDTIAWVARELDGYPTDADIPGYREIRGVAKALNPVRGWLKIEFEDPHLEEQLSTQKSRQPISQIQEMAQSTDGTLTFLAPSALVGRIQFAHDPRIFVARSQIVSILDGVRNRVLDWALALEERGVLGDGLSFLARREGAVNSPTSPLSLSFHAARFVLAGKGSGIAGPSRAGGWSWPLPPGACSQDEGPPRPWAISNARPAFLLDVLRREPTGAGRRSLPSCKSGRNT